MWREGGSRNRAYFPNSSCGDSSKKGQASEGPSRPGVFCLHDTIPLLSAWVAVAAQSHTLSLSPERIPPHPTLRRPIINSVEPPNTLYCSLSKAGRQHLSIGDLIYPLVKRLYHHLLCSYDQSL